LHATAKTDDAMINLNTKAWISLAGLMIVMGLLLFVPGGTVYYLQGWVFLSVFTVTSIFITLNLMKHDPALLERRMRGGPTAEKQPMQRLIMLATSIGFICLLVVPALDFRFGWSAVSLSGIVGGNVLVMTGFYFISLVYKENTFASATIEIAEGQKVISTGPYAIVRHPMYASASIYLIGMPIALGSYWGLIVFGAMIPFLLLRLIDEERFLAKNLPGYVEYQMQVRYRLIPFVW